MADMKTDGGENEMLRQHVSTSSPLPSPLCSVCKKELRFIDGIALTIHNSVCFACAKEIYEIYNKEGLKMLGTIRKDGTIHFNGLTEYEVVNHFALKGASR